MEWSIQELARSAGTTSRTLRHYDQVGLLTPSRIGRNGYRYYDEVGLLRLQRIPLLRELGLGLAEINRVLDGERDSGVALRTHLRLLEQERERIGRQIESVRTTLRKLEGGEQIMADEAFEGFDHTRYEQEVTQRWGREAYQQGDRWWRSLSKTEQRDFMQRQLDIAADFGRAHAAAAPVDGDEVQAITRRHHEWLTMAGNPVHREYFLNLAEMYVADPRFTANYDRHGEGTAVFIRDAMKVYAERVFGG
ncbi:MerR family transcriptional regulator [Plantactinospora sp. B5E13]|uniref:MerR family transcriptional regulator n=1 Tax=Plantactinospora sp. B5E13 TaxID=3153758 RepID=UPI00325C8BD6